MRDQKKNQKSRRISVPPRGCRVKRDRKRSLYDVKISGSGTLLHSDKAKLALSRTLCTCWEKVITLLNQIRRSGGARRDRTDDILLAKQALSQLSYGPNLYLTEPVNGWPGQTRTADLTLIRRAL